MPEDFDQHLARVVVDLVRLSRLLPPEEFVDMLGAVSVEVETGMERVVERSLTTRRNGNVVAFPTRQASSHGASNPW